MSRRAPGAADGVPLAIPRPAELLARHGVRPDKRLGQHFLVDRAHLARIVGAAELAADDVVLEIGPGLGVLTAALCDRAGQVVAVEVDGAMRAVLADTLGDRPNLSVVAADILDVDPGALVRGPLGPGAPAGARGVAPRYKVVANLPYYITSAILRRILEAPLKPARVVVMVQREVADRICAAPGDMSLLAVSVQLYALPRRVAVVPAGAFHPRPKVDSAVLALDVHAAPVVDIPSEAALFAAARAGFGQKRKQLRNSVAAGLGCAADAAAAALAAAGVDPARRAETLALAEWAAATRALVAAGLLDPEGGAPEAGPHAAPDEDAARAATTAAAGDGRA